MHGTGTLQTGPALPAGVYPDTARVRQILIFTMMLASLFVLDIGTTQFILRLGGMELNPLMTGVVTNPALHLAIKSAILLAAILVAVLSERYVRGSSTYFYTVLITLYIFIVVNNLFVILPRLVL